MDIKCPNCGTDHVTKFTVYKDKKKSGGGCTGCLLLIIIFILAPSLVLIFGLLTGATIYYLKTPLIIALIIGLVLSIIIRIYQSKLYIYYISVKVVVKSLILDKVYCLTLFL